MGFISPRWLCEGKSQPRRGSSTVQRHRERRCRRPFTVLLGLLVRQDDNPENHDGFRIG
jgi:hypothetical protein